MSEGPKFERKIVLTLKGVDGALRDFEITQGPRLLRFRFPAGAQIFKEGDPGDNAFLIESGLVRIVQATTETPQVKISTKAAVIEPGRVAIHQELEQDAPMEVELARLGAGALFGELALIDGMPRSASAVALENTVCVAVSSPQLDTHLQQATPELAARIRVLMAFIRAVPARATWPKGEFPRERAGDIAAVRVALDPRDRGGPLEIPSPFLRAVYRSLCEYALSRFP
ncbi:MAG: cyclic nucleotide-binding domain-containing protein [Alphaproteobacteria bacterium]|nr:cyclic nucleotide-binding domain-containing protein [Alphaproteobacteria bacterium]